MRYLQRNIILPTLGIDKEIPPEYIGERSTPNCKNIQIENNIIKKRLGMTVLGTAPMANGPVLAVTELYSGGVRYVVRIGIRKAERLIGNTWTDITPATQLSGTSSDMFSTTIPILAGARILVFTNYIDAIKKWVPIGNFADLGGVPSGLRAKYVLAYGVYLILAHINTGSLTVGNRVQWSDTGAIETWTGGNSGSVDLVEDGNNITGMNIFGSYIAVHKETSIYLGYMVNTSDIFIFDRKYTGVGTISNNSIQNLNTGDQIFLANDGIRIFNGLSTNLIPSGINNEIAKTINYKYLSNCWSVVVPEINEYWLGIPTYGDIPSEVYKFNYKTGQAYKDNRRIISAVGKYLKTTDITIGEMTGMIKDWDSKRFSDVYPESLNSIIIFGDRDGNTFEREKESSPEYKDMYQDGGSTAIDAEWETKDYEGKDPGRLCRWIEMQIWAYGSSVSIKYSKDSGMNWSSPISITLAGDYPTDDSPKFAYFDVVSSKIRFKISNATAGETFALKKMTVKFAECEMRH